MMRVLPLLVCAWLLVPSLAAAEESSKDAEWLGVLRHSGSYQRGMKQVREKIDFAYDLGAVKGALHWETIHSYYIELARAKGCKKGAPYADGPIKTCHEVSKTQPKLLGAPYEEGRTEIVTVSLETLDPGLVRQVLLVIYDYGYVHGMKHGLRKRNDDLRWVQSFYKSCVARANDAEHEPACAKSSKSWSKDLLKRLRAQVEAHGLPVGKKPE